MRAARTRFCRLESMMLEPSTRASSAALLPLALRESASKEMMHDTKPLARGMGEVKVGVKGWGWIRTAQGFRIRAYCTRMQVGAQALATSRSSTREAELQRGSCTCWHRAHQKRVLVCAS